MKREIWVVEYNIGARIPNWIEQSRHSSLKAATKAAIEYTSDWSCKHRVRKLKPNRRPT